jgi:O-antigen/teichoic acid export membrane protein
MNTSSRWLESGEAPNPGEPNAEKIGTESTEHSGIGARLRRWGIQTSLSIVDQGLTAAAGFAVNLLLARWLSAEAYGAFAVAFAGYLFVSGFHNVLLLEPLSVLGPARHAGQLPQYFRAQLGAHLFVMGLVSVVTLLVGLAVLQFAPASLLAGAVIGGSIALPALLLLWLVRRMCYVCKRPAFALLGSGVYLAVILVSLLAARAFGATEPFWAFLLMGCASLLSSLVVMRRLGMRSVSGDAAALPWKDVLHENWVYGRWLMGSAVLFPAVSQLQMVLAAALLGLGSAGVLRAMQIPSLVMTQVVTAAGLLVLPVFSYDFGLGQVQRLRQRATVVSVALAGVTLGFVLLLIWFAGPVEHLLFGGKYGPYAWLMPVLALIPMISGFGTGYSVAVRASQQPHYDLVANLVAAPIGLISAVLFMRWWGVFGAAASMVLGFAVLSLTTYVCFRLARNQKPAPAVEAFCD